MTAFWVAENPSSDVTSTDIALGLVNLVPKTLQGATTYSRQLLTTSSIDVRWSAVNSRPFTGWPSTAWRSRGSARPASRRASAKAPT